MCPNVVSMYLFVVVISYSINVNYNTLDAHNDLSQPSYRAQCGHS